MTRNEMNAAIAEANGWTCIIVEHGSLRGNPCGLESARTHVRDYCNDLNAMHEVEHRLDGHKNAIYGRWLQYIASRMSAADFLFDAGWPRSLACVYGLTAFQRAEAYLRTIGKWR